MKYIYSLILASLCLFISLSIISCGEDDVQGCTNGAADNFNSLATDDDGSCIITGCTNEIAENFNPAANNSDFSVCIFPRDKFLGEYTGSVNCVILDQFNSMTASILIESVADDLSKISITLTSEDFTFPLDATADGNELAMTATDFLLSVTLVGEEMDVFIDLDGTTTLDESGNELSGILDIRTVEATSGQTITNDKCSLIATKI